MSVRLNTALFAPSPTRKLPNFYSLPFYKIWSWQSNFWKANTTRNYQKPKMYSLRANSIFGLGWATAELLTLKILQYTLRSVSGRAAFSPFFKIAKIRQNGHSLQYTIRKSLGYLQTFIHLDICKNRQIRRILQHVVLRFLERCTLCYIWQVPCRKERHQKAL